MSKTFSHAKDREALEDREYDRQARRNAKDTVRSMATRTDTDRDTANREYSRMAFNRQRRA